MQLKQKSLKGFLNNQSKVEKDKVTPMIAQYLDVKSRHEKYLLFYRMGDFYELFFKDAIIASKELNITLTKRGKYKNEDIPMCGVPYHASQNYISRLIKLGYKVAIAEQLTEQSNSKIDQTTQKKYSNIFPRDVVRIITPGTILDESMLESKNNNFLLSIFCDKGFFCISWVDVTTGEFKVKKLTSKNINEEIEEIFFKLDPKEILLTDDLNENVLFSKQFSAWKEKITIIPNSYYDNCNSEERLKILFNTQNLHSIGDFSRIEISCLGALVQYMSLTQKSNSPRFMNILKEDDNSYLQLDKISSLSLEIFSKIDGQKKGSLISIIDQTLTSGGSRLLREHIRRPLLQIEQINRRLDHVSMFYERESLITNMRDILKGLPDAERAMSRITAKFNNPRDVISILNFIKKSLDFFDILEAGCPEFSDLRPGNLELRRIKFLGQLITKTMISEPPTNTNNGGVIKDGFDKNLDDLRNSKSISHSEIIKLQQKYIQSTGINTLKIKFNNFHGYFVEVTKKNSNIIQEHEAITFNLVQSTINVCRYQTIELKHLTDKIYKSDFESLELEKNIFNNLIQNIIKVSDSIYYVCKKISYLDVILSHSHLSHQKNYTRPRFNQEPIIKILKGRHPVVEESLTIKDQEFIANDCNLCLNKKTWLMTGPNMAGKSTFLRQVAIIVLLAQIGSFVPAESVEIGIVDRIFTRIGASDDLSLGQSTFMTEMVETARILNGSTENSLVILDEVGRGTSTADGFSLAWSILEFIVKKIKCSTLFATHYHDLTELAVQNSEISLKTLQSKEYKDDIIFLYKVVDGISKSSFGIHVAKIAGINFNVIQKAKLILEKIDKKNSIKNVSQIKNSEYDEVNEENKEIIKIIKKINLDNITPKQSLDILYNLKNILE